MVLPINPKVAFELLVAVFEADGVAVENCGEHDWEVQCAFERAAGVMTVAAKSLQAAELKEKVTALMAVDSYGIRESLTSVLASVGES